MTVSSISFRIHGDRLDGVLNHEWSVDKPSLDGLNSALDRLDGTTYTTLIVDGNGKEHMTIGGGNGRYIVYWTADDLQFKTLLRPHAEQATVVLSVGGKKGDYPARHVVDLAQARAAASFFFLHRQLDPDLTWETE